jgi:sporulation protein YtfJ
MDTTTPKQPHNITEILNTSLENLKKLVDVDTVVGKPITTPEGTVIIPVSKVTFGFGAGGGDIPTTKGGSPFGGGSGGATTITPLAFLVITQGRVELLNIAAPHNTLDRAVDMVPGLIDKVGLAFAGLDLGGKGKKAGQPPASAIAADPVEP